MKKQNLKKIGAFATALFTTATMTLGMVGCGSGEDIVPVESAVISPAVEVIKVDTKGIIPKELSIAETEYGKVDLSGIDPKKPMIALTFDDGPGEGTEKILSVLKKHKSKATFFELGSNVKKYPQMTKKLADARMQVASHTYDHLDLGTLSGEKIQEQYSKTDKAIKEAAGTTVTAVRAPYGSVSDTVKSNTPYPIILWDIDTLDWYSRNTEEICNSVYNETLEDGDILLFHDIYGTTADAIEILVPYLKEKGFQLVTIDQMFAAKKIPLEKGGVYTNA